MTHVDIEYSDKNTRLTSHTFLTVLKRLLLLKSFFICVVYFAMCKMIKQEFVTKIHGVFLFLLAWKMKSHQQQSSEDVLNLF